MNVKMAAQTLSSSVASAIDFLREDMDTPDFQGSEATTVFIRCIDELFDLLHSRNPFGTGNKAPITKLNLLQFMGKCEDLSRYIFNLKAECCRFLQNDRKKTVLWGFAFTLQSVMAICKELLTQKLHKYSYVLTYKLSQDHIELLFNKMKRWHGWNNNLHVLEFKWAL